MMLVAAVATEEHDRANPLPREMVEQDREKTAAGHRRHRFRPVRDTRAQRVSHPSGEK